MKKISGDKYQKELSLLYLMPIPMIIIDSNLEWFPIENEGYQVLNQYCNGSFWEAIGFKSDAHIRIYEKWFNHIFTAEGKDLKQKAPRKTTFNKKAYDLKIEYLENEQNEIEKVLILFMEKSEADSGDRRSKSSIKLLKNEIEGLKESLEMSAKMIKNKEVYQSLCSEFTKTIDQTLELLKDENFEEVKEYLVKLHYGFEYSFNFYQTKPLVKFVKEQREKINFNDSDSVKEHSADLSKGLMILRNMFININSRIKNYTGESINIERKFVEINRAHVDELTSEIQKNIKSMIINQLLSKDVFSVLKIYEDALYDMCIEHGKNPVDVKYLGDNFNFPFEKYDSFFASFFTYLQNVVEHGIEDPAVRKEKNKSETGKVTFLTSVTSSDGRSYYKIEIVDDGKGIHPKTIKEKLQQMGVPLPEGIRNMEVFQYLFDKNFSISDKKNSDMGLYLLKKSVESVSGKVQISSRPNMGTKLEVFLPD